MADPVILEVELEPPTLLVELVTQEQPLQVELGIPGPPGQPGPPGDDITTDLTLLYQIAKL